MILHRKSFVAAGAVFFAAELWSALHRRLTHNCLHRTGTTRTTSLQNRKLEQRGSDGKLVIADPATVCMGSHPRFGRELQMSRPGDRSRALHCTLSTTRQSFRARIITPLLEKDDSNGDKQSANSRPAGRNVRNCACAEGTDQPCR